MSEFKKCTPTRHQSAGDRIYYIVMLAAYTSLALSALVALLCYAFVLIDPLRQILTMEQVQWLARLISVDGGSSVVMPYVMIPLLIGIVLAFGSLAVVTECCRREERGTGITKK